MRLRLCAAALAVGLLPLAASADPRYTVVDVGNLADYGNGGFNSQSPPTSWAYSINDQGDAVGYSYVTRTTAETKAFLYSDGTLHNIGTPNGTGNSYAYGINNSGLVAGMYLSGEYAAGTQRGFVYDTSTGMHTDIGNLGGNARISGINNAGVVVGDSRVAGATYAQAFTWANGQFTLVPTLTPGAPMSQYNFSVGNGINDHGTVVGYSANPDAMYHAYRYTADGVMTDLPTLGEDYYFASANAINNNNLAVGVSGWNMSEELMAVAWNGNAIVPLGYLTGGYRSEALSVNDAGQIVGYSLSNRTNASNPIGQRAFLYEDGQMLFLDDLMAPDSGWQLISAQAINERGDITGMGLYQGERRAFVLYANPVPEPASAVMLLAGLGVLILCRHRRH